jgi:hypothetical protein
MNRVLIGSIALTLALGPAAIASANTVVRTTESGRDVIYVKGLTANQQVTLNTTGGNRAVAVAACKNEGLGSQKTLFSARIICKN